LDVPDKGRDDLGVAMATGGGSHFPDPHDPNGNFRTRSTHFEAKREVMLKSQAFHNFDGRILRFECIVANKEDESVADKIVGITKRYSLTYNLGDQTMEIRVVKEKRSTYDEVTSLLKKSRLAKNWREVQKGNAAVYYEPADLICGKIIECYGRFLLLTDCDAFTRRMYEDMGILQRQIVISDYAKPEVKHYIPKLGDGFLAIGSEEDTLASVPGMPKPFKDLEKMQRNQGRILRCKTKLITDKEIDRGRTFMVTFRLEDDSVQIYEEIVRNSGLGGGNFLKRGKYINTLPHDSVKPRGFQATDFYLGNVFCINGSEMQIVEMDNLSLKFCESYPEEFPMFDTFQIVQHVIDKVASKRLDVRQEMVKYDRNGVGYLPRELFVHVLDEIELTSQLNDQELLTVLRRFQNGDNYHYDEMCDLFSHIFYLKHTGDRERSEFNQRSLDIGKMAFLNTLRGNKQQIRRILRRSAPVSRGCVILSAMIQVLAKSGLKLSDKNKEFIIANYSLSRAEASQVLPALIRDQDNIIEPSNRPLSSKSNSRVDIRSSARLTSTIGYSAATDVQSRRQQLSKSVLRKSESSGLKPDVKDGVIDDSNIVISYKMLCDEIYPCDWAF
jgi:hypothetical protein